MPGVRLQRALKVPPVPAYQALADVLRAIEAQEGAWRGFALHVNLGDLHFPDVGYLAIPIRLSVGKAQVETHALQIAFESAKHKELFPRFEGSAGIDATGPSGSILWLAGSYDAPMKLFGALADATVASGLAARTLENLADDLAEACAANVEKREADYVRYHLFNR